MQYATSGYDVINLGRAVLVWALAAYLHYAGMRRALAPTRANELPNWSGAAAALGVAVLLAGLAGPAFWLTRNEDPNELLTFRSLAGSHNWSANVFSWGVLAMSSGFLFFGVLPALAVWRRARKQRRDAQQPTQSDRD